jgi:hypothetical protein
MDIRGAVGAGGGDLAATLIPSPKIHKARYISLPFGRVAFTRDKGNGKILGFGDEPLMSNLHAIHRDAEGKLLDIYDLGSGSTTNPGVNCLVNDVLAWALSPALAKFNFHGCGTGATASAITDFWLQTAIASGSLTGSTNGYFTGAQTLVAPNIYKTVATTVFGSTQAVTEWVLTMSNGAPFTGRSFTSTTANSGTDTGAAFTTAGNGLMGWSVESAAAVVNTPTSTVFGTVTTNSATVLTLGVTTAGGWWTLANASGSTPGGTSAYVVYPTTLDHKVFSVINVNSGDSIQWVYQLTLTPQV